MQPKKVFQNIEIQDTTHLVKEVVNDSLPTSNKINHQIVSSTAKPLIIQSNVQVDTIKKAKEYEFLNITSNSATFIESYNNTSWFNDFKGKILNLRQTATKTSNTSEIFLTIANQKSDNRVLINPREKLGNQSDWYFLPIFIGIIVLSLVYRFYRKYIGQLFESVVFRFVSKKLVNDKNIILKRFGFILDLLFIVSFSLFIDQLLVKFNLYVPPEKFEYIVVLGLSIFLIFLRIFRFLIYRISSLISDQHGFMKDLYINTLIYNRLIGIFLLPLIFLVIYTTLKISTILLYISILFVVIVLIYRTIRSIVVFLDNGLSIFYFILYLCALEIAPLLIFWKEVQERM